MGSELWQRLRAARKYADLRQEDVAKWCKVSRPAVAQWEANTLDKRTMPSVDQIEMVSKATGVPVEWLMNNNVDPDTVWQAAQTKGAPAVDVAAKNLESAFANAIKYFVIRERPDLDSAFERRMNFITTRYVPDFMYGRTIVEIKLSGIRLEDACGQLLLAERACGSRLHKMLIVSGDLVSDEVAQQVGKLWEIEVVRVRSPEEAAQAILRAV